MKSDAQAGKKEVGWGEGIFAHHRFSAAVLITLLLRNIFYAEYRNNHSL